VIITSWIWTWAWHSRASQERGVARWRDTWSLPRESEQALLGLGCIVIGKWCHRHLKPVSVSLSTWTCLIYSGFLRVIAHSTIGLLKIPWHRHFPSRPWSPVPVHSHPVSMLPSYTPISAYTFSAYLHLGSPH